MRRFLLPFVLVFAFSLFGEIEYGISNRRGEHSIPLDWSTCTFDEAIDETFGIKLNGENVNDSLIMRYKKILKNEKDRSISAALKKEVKQLKKNFENKQKTLKQNQDDENFSSSDTDSPPKKQPESYHLAIVRIIVTNSDNNTYVYNVPYVFLSGTNPKKTIKNEKMPKIFTNGVLQTIISCGGRGYVTGSAQSFAHSERAVGLFLIYDSETDGGIFLTQLLNFHNNKNNNENKIQKLTIEIKTLLPMCPNCQSFFRNQAKCVKKGSDILFCGSDTVTNNGDIKTTFKITKIFRQLIETYLTQENGNELLDFCGN